MIIIDVQADILAHDYITFKMVDDTLYVKFNGQDFIKSTTPTISKWIEYWAAIQYFPRKVYWVE